MIIHFLNVGHGDCTVIEHDSGNLSVVDINNGDSIDETTLNEIHSYYNNGIPSKYEAIKTAGYNISLTNPIHFLNDNYPNKSIFRYVQTHPHLDHLRGLHSLNECKIIHNFWDTQHDYSPSFTKEGDSDNWNTYLQLRNRSIKPKTLRLNNDSKGCYYNQDENGILGGDGIEVLYPFSDMSQYNIDFNDPNNLSYILRIISNGLKIILGGDASVKVWDIVADKYKNKLKCDVLKASHHGRKSGYSLNAIKYMRPEYVVVSVGKKPETDAYSNYKVHCKNIWSTRWRGNIILNTYRKKIKGDIPR